MGGALQQPQTPSLGAGEQPVLVDTKQVLISGVLQAPLSLGAPAYFLLFRFVPL